MSSDASFLLKLHGLFADLTSLTAQPALGTPNSSDRLSSLPIFTNLVGVLSRIGNIRTMTKCPWTNEPVKYSSSLQDDVRAVLFSLDITYFLARSLSLTGVFSNTTHPAYTGTASVREVHTADPECPWATSVINVLKAPQDQMYDSNFAHEYVATCVRAGVYDALLDFAAADGCSRPLAASPAGAAGAAATARQRA